MLASFCRESEKRFALSGVPARSSRQKPHPSEQGLVLIGSHRSQSGRRPWAVPRARKPEVGEDPSIDDGVVDRGDELQPPGTASLTTVEQLGQEERYRRRLVGAPALDSAARVAYQYRQREPWPFHDKRRAPCVISIGGRS